MSDNNDTKGVVVGINGNMVIVELQSGKPTQNEVAFVQVGEERLKAEVIRITGETANLQVFEDTTGITVGMEVDFTGKLLSLALAPGASEREVIDRYRPSLLVYFTDGEGPAPTRAPSGLPVLWVLTGVRPAVPATWGRTVKMSALP